MFNFNIKNVLIWTAIVVIALFVISNVFNIIAFFAKVAIVVVPLFFLNRWMKLKFDILGVLFWIVGGFLIWKYIAPPILSLAAWLTPVLIVLGVIYFVVVSLDYFGREKPRS